MDRILFNTFMDEVFAAFQKPRPRDAVLNVIFKQVESLPDDFVAWAAEQLQDSDKLPLNVGRHLRKTLYPEWLSGHLAPQAGGLSGDPLCRECRGEGWFLVWRKDAGPGTAPTAHPCMCNRIVDSWMEYRPRKVCLADLKRDGWTFHEPPMVRDRPPLPLSRSLQELLDSIHAGKGLPPHPASDPDADLRALPAEYE